MSVASYKKVFKALVYVLARDALRETVVGCSAPSGGDSEIRDGSE